MMFMYKIKLQNLEKVAGLDQKFTKKKSLIPQWLRDLKFKIIHFGELIKEICK